MAKRKTPIDRAIDAIEAEIAVSTATLKRLMAVRDAVDVQRLRRVRQAEQQAKKAPVTP